MQLDERRWPEVGSPDAPTLLAVPVGSCEQHGPHLPLGTDTLVAHALAIELCRRRSDALATPPLAITASGEHQGFPGTLSIGAAAMETVLVELVRSADWAAGIVLVNGHGGNATAVRRAVAQLRDEGRQVLAWWPSVEGGDPHAGDVETSLVLALRPDLVRVDLAVPGPVPTIDELARDGVLAHSPTGVLGDPTGADAERGRELLRRLADQLVDAVAEWAPHDDETR